MEHQVSWETVRNVVAGHVYQIPSLRVWSFKHSGRNTFSVFGFSFPAGHASEYFNNPGITDFA